MGKTKSSPDGIQDLSLDVIRRKRIRIDHDDNRILELNTSDLNILARLKEAYPQLVSLANNAFKQIPEIEVDEENYDLITDEATAQLINALTEADTRMRELVDYIFDSNVSEVCAPHGSMYDPINGKFRFEHIIELLSNLYETDVSTELNQISARVKKHTSKYIG